ncbi:ABC transporter ATP-binding protein [Actinomyces sp. B33]|uniref:ABC transporter ATP-binding protein n=1 Tax=Actinomyces sp. B33 TaxID=2942131 RepID=UPI002341BEB9|nr:ABC transporter ATP-binding protein [Actinomyces sp. B33]MDC4233784.1 ABC transporter ATP-binding protein [Actinomyces sp. B33]
MTTPAPGDHAPLLAVTRLTKTYRGAPALDDLTLSLDAGHIVGLLGPNGSGKTTLLKILAGVLADWTGDVSIAGHRPGHATKGFVSYLPSVDFLDPALTCQAAIDLYDRFFADFDAAKARRMVDFFRLPADKTLKEMSKGMGEKLQIALVMSRRSRVYLLDEPISGVDPAARDYILQGILSEFDPDALLLMSTHLIADIEPIIDHALFLADGRLLMSGDADDLRAEHGMSLDALFRKEYR